MIDDYDMILHNISVESYECIMAMSPDRQWSADLPTISMKCGETLYSYLTVPSVHFESCILLLLFLGTSIVIMYMKPKSTVHVSTRPDPIHRTLGIKYLLVISFRNYLGLCLGSVYNYCWWHSVEFAPIRKQGTQHSPCERTFVSPIAWFHAVAFPSCGYFSTLQRDGGVPTLEGEEPRSSWRPCVVYESAYWTLTVGD